MYFRRTAARARAAPFYFINQFDAVVNHWIKNANPLDLDFPSASPGTTARRAGSHHPESGPRRRTTPDGIAWWMPPVFVESVPRSI